MSLDLDPTEQRIAAALTRIAEAHVPQVLTSATSVDLAPTDHRRRVTFAVAAVLVALLVGALLALAGPDDAIGPADDPAPPPTPSMTMPPDDGRIAVLGADGGLGTGSTAGAIDLFLTADRPSRAVWQFVAPSDGDRPRDAFTLTLAADDSPMDPACCDEALVTIDGRIGRRFADPDDGDVSVLVPDQRVDILLRSTASAAEDAIDWLDEHLGELVNDWARNSRPLRVVEGPDRFAAIPPLVSSELVSYRGGTTIMTERYASAVDADDLIAARWPRAATSLVGQAVHVDTEPEALVWQLEPHVVVTVEGANVERLEPHLLMVDRRSAGLTPVTSEVPVPGLSRRFPESELTRIALIETDFGRFVYAEAPSDQGVCRAWVSKYYGGSSCTTEEEDALSRVDPDVSCPGGSGRAGGVFVLALVHGRSDATIQMTRDGASVEVAVARGVASDGSPYTIGFFADTTADVNTPGVETDPVVDTIKVDGVDCFSAVDEEAD